MDRIWELDFARGMAVMLMIVFHLVVDLKDLYFYPISYTTGSWYWIGKFSAILFILTAGISCTLSNHTTKHGIVVFLWGILLTATTYLYDPLTYIRFGILHFLGCSVLTYHRLIRKITVPSLAVLAVVVIAAGQMAATITVKTPVFIPLGIVPNHFISLDYYPILPWYSFFLAGVSIGKVRYAGRRRPVCGLTILEPVACLGRHSLSIYLLHQPLLIAILFFYHLL